jgi:hypothetical protein
MTTALLLLLGVVMGAIGFATVMSMGDLLWHSGRDAELVATYQAYEETGTLLVKETGSGSYGVQAPADGPLTFATWDDDPGSYIIASLMSHVTGSPSPYPGLTIAQGLLVAIPLVWLPLAVARIVGRARAGFALILLPLVTWLFNHGATLVGTEYGLSDRVSTLPVYSLYGTAASLAFLSLSLIVLLSSYRLKLVGLIVATLGIAVLAALGNMSRSLSGMGIAAAVGVLWWIFARRRRRWRWVAAVGGALAAVLLAMVIQTGLMTAINTQRAETTGQAMAEVPDAHTAWHSLYLGLSYPTPLNGQASHFPVIWSDEYGWEKAREVDPDVLVASEEYDAILKDLYFEQVLADPVGAVKLYLQKAWFLAKHFGGLLLFIATGFIVGMSIRSRMRPLLGRVLAIATPLLLLGLVPAILVMPMLYYYSELSAALGLLAAVSLGVLAWALTSWPARVRAKEARRLYPDDAAEHAPGVSVVVDADAFEPATLDAVIADLSDADEIVIAASSDDAVDLAGSEHGRLVRRVVEPGSGVGHRLRTAVLLTTGRRVLVWGAPGDVQPADVVALARADGEARDDAAPASATGSRDVLREAFLGSATPAAPIFALDGSDARALARASREEGSQWFDEMLFGAAQRRVEVTTVDGTSRVDTHSGFFARLRGWGRIALRREEYAGEPAR